MTIVTWLVRTVAVLAGVLGIAAWLGLLGALLADLERDPVPPPPAAPGPTSSRRRLQ